MYLTVSINILNLPPLTVRLEYLITIVTNLTRIIFLAITNPFLHIILDMIRLVMLTLDLILDIYVTGADREAYIVARPATLVNKANFPMFIQIFTQI